MRIIGNDPSVPRQTHEVASGTLPNGKPVIVNADGTVSVVSGTDQALGSAVVFQSNTMQKIASAFDSNSNKIVLAYRGGSAHGTAIVGTISGSSVSFGTAVVFQSAAIGNVSMSFDSTANKVVIAYTSSGGKAIVGTVSGTGISFGSVDTIDSGLTTTIENTATVYDPDNNKTVVIVKDGGDGDKGFAYVGTVSGTSISFGSQVTMSSSSIGNSLVAVYDTNSNKVVVGYKDAQVVVGTVSGTSISFGSVARFTTNTQIGFGMAFDSANNKIVAAIGDYSNDTGKAFVGTVSGTSISFGSGVTFNAGATIDIAVTFDTNVGKVVIAYRDSGNSQYGTVITGAVSGTSISLDTELVYESARSEYNSIVYDSNANKSLISYGDLGNSTYGTSIVFTAGSQNLTSENYIGISRSGAASGAGAIIDTQGALADIPVSNYNIASASYDNKTLDVSGQEGSPRGMVFNSDGTKVYVVGTFSDNLSQYNCSTAYDISTASYSGTNFSFASQDTQPHDIVFNNDGTKLYMIGLTNDAIFRYSLSSAYNISTLSYDSVSFSVGSQATSPRGLTFGSNGNKLYVSDQGNDRIYEYNLSTAYDATSASYNSVNFDPTSEESNPSNVAFNSTGTKMFIAGNNTVYQYSLSTAFDLSTVSYDSISFNASSQVIDSYDIHFNPDGSKMYIVDIDNTALFQYSTSVSLTPAQSYFVQTDGTLGTTAANPSVFAGTAVSATKLIVKG